REPLRGKKGSDSAVVAPVFRNRRTDANPLPALAEQNSYTLPSSVTTRLSSRSASVTRVRDRESTWGITQCSKVARASETNSIVLHLMEQFVVFAQKVFAQKWKTFPNSPLT